MYKEKKGIYFYYYSSTKETEMTLKKSKERIKVLNEGILNGFFFIGPHPGASASVPSRVPFP